MDIGAEGAVVTGRGDAPGTAPETADRVTRRGVLRGAGIAALAPIALRPEAASAATSREPLSGQALERRLRSRFATNGNVRLHYTIAGSGPLILFVHGFPAWWWTWRNTMAPLVEHFTVAAMDTRGYNLSDKPRGVENYEPLLLASDVRAVIEHTGHRTATVVGHDWGGALSWLLATISPEVVDRLVILNMPHPSELAQQLASNPQQRDASRYVLELQRPDALSRPLPAQLGGGDFTAENLAKQLNRPATAAYARDVAALRRTSLQAALNYYVAGYPKPPYTQASLGLPKVKASTLVIYGREDPFLLIEGLDRTWDRVERAVEIRVVPNAGHWVQFDAPATVNQALREWLARTPA